MANLIKLSAFKSKLFWKSATGKHNILHMGNAEFGKLNFFLEGVEYWID